GSPLNKFGCDDRLRSRRLAGKRGAERAGYSPAATIGRRKRCADRALAFAASITRSRAGWLVTKPSTKRRATPNVSSTARLNAASLAFDGALKPLSLRTN